VAKFLLGVLVAVVTGVLVDLLTGGTTRLLRILRVRLSGARSISYDPVEDRLYMLGEWSPARRLTADRLVTRTVTMADRSPSSLVDPHVLTQAKAANAGHSGDIVYLSSFRLDHRESADTQECRVTLSESDYVEVRAIEHLRKSSPGHLARCDEALARGPRAYLEQAVPSSIAINILPVIERTDVLCAQRSGAVDNGVGLWTIGIFEAMKRSDPHTPGRSEDFFGLAYRALEEELGLRPQDCGQIELTWLGIYGPLLRGHVVAVVPVRLGRADLIDRAHSADSSYEHLSFDWLALRRETVLEFIDAPRVARPDEVGSALEVSDRLWIEQSRLALREAWRFRSCLDIES